VIRAEVTTLYLQRPPLKQLAISLAGPLAERMALGRSLETEFDVWMLQEFSWHGPEAFEESYEASDLTHATHCLFGLWCGVTGKDLHEAREPDFDRLVRLYRANEARTRRLLTRKWARVERLAERLLEKGGVEGHDI
jgi:hypothetical protein